MRGPLDIHVHIIGDGTANTGCWIRLGGWNRVLARLMLRDLGIAPGAMGRNLDKLYVEKLLEYIRRSELEAVVILAHELPRDERGRPIPGAGSFYVPNDYVLELGNAHRELLPAVSIHPAREDALDELDRCVALGARMMKCLPNCQNIDCADPRFRPFWKKMADYGLPLLAHTGGEMSVQVMNRAYQNPEILRGPLDCGVTVVAAHLASASHPFDTDYLATFVKMLEEYPHLFGDNSALNSPFRSKALAPSLAEPILSRCVHGSDLPIPISGLYARLRGVIDTPVWRQACREKNLLQRDYLLKVGMGYPREVFTRGWDLLRTV